MRKIRTQITIILRNKKIDQMVSDIPMNFDYFIRYKSKEKLFICLSFAKY